MIPSYGKRAGWVPKTIEDFADGGAYPEINVPQFPIVGAGNQMVKKDVVAKFLPPTDLGPIDLASVSEEKLSKPKKEDLLSTIERTKAALEAITKKKISSSLPNRCATATEPSTYIKYVPQQSSSQKIIRMVNIQKDPCEPPKFRINKKIPQGPPSPPAPVMHSPPRKLTVSEQKEWRIPPCISNWKNPKGYTIPLDKRLAADGRGTQGVQINDKFAKFAEALYIADRKAREGVEMRAQIEKKLAQKEKEKKEDILKKLAQKAREERAGLKKTTGEEEVEERDQIRADKQKERRREKNLERAAPHIKNKNSREREITEQIALNLANPKASSNELSFDQRLIDQTRGISSGFGDEDDYSVYDKPWKESTKVGNSIYRPRGLQDTEDEISKITGKSFSGAKHGDRDGPVPFVPATKSTQASNEDIFGIDTFLKEAKKSTKRKHEN